MQQTIVTPRRNQPAVLSPSLFLSTPSVTWFFSKNSPTIFEVCLGSLSCMNLWFCYVFFIHVNGTISRVFLCIQRIHYAFTYHNRSPSKPTNTAPDVYLYRVLWSRLWFGTMTNLSAAKSCVTLYLNACLITPYHIFKCTIISGIIYMYILPLEDWCHINVVRSVFLALRSPPNPCNWCQAQAHKNS